MVATTVRCACRSQAIGLNLAGRPVDLSSIEWRAVTLAKLRTPPAISMDSQSCGTFCATTECGQFDEVRVTYTPFDEANSQPL